MSQRGKKRFIGKNKKKGSQNFLKLRNPTNEDGLSDSVDPIVEKLMAQPSGSGAGGRGRQANRYNLHFYQETQEELEKMKHEGYVPLTKVDPKEREIDARYFEGFNIPIRPKWTYKMDKETVIKNENRYFRMYVENLQRERNRVNGELSLYELNLETWRQLWRVLELSDIILIVVDIRFSSLTFSPALYEYIVNVMKKDVILVLNKVDLVNPEVIIAWQHYFRENYPKLSVVLFASYQQKLLKGKARGRTAYRRSMEGIHDIYRECYKIVNSAIDITAWEKKILEDMESADALNGRVEYVADDSNPPDTPYDEKSALKYHNNIVSIGCVGFPNVGKSSLINALKGRKVVSVSRTPGHTKHFQTIFLTENVRLCDCPGLVFPSSTPKHLQVLFGVYPIAQLRVPYRSLKFLAEHIDLPKLLHLRLPDGCEEWTATDIADAWALKRGYLTAKAGRPDRSRAANQLLRMCLGGQQNIILQFYPPRFHEDKEKFLNDPDLQTVKIFQNAEFTNDANATEEALSNESDGAEDSNADEDGGASSSSDQNQNVFALLSDDD